MSDDNPLSDRFDPIEPNEEDQNSPTETSQDGEKDSPDNVDKTAKTDAPNNENKSGETSKSDTRRDRPHTAMYISADLVGRMKDRYRKINGELMINEGEEIELNKHFYEGLIKAGLENPDLKDIVLEQREEE